MPEGAVCGGLPRLEPGILSDYMKVLPAALGPWFNGRLHCLGTAKKPRSSP
jgi:hypothetical protein